MYLLMINVEALKGVLYNDVLYSAVFSFKHLQKSGNIYFKVIGSHSFYGRAYYDF